MKLQSHIFMPSEIMALSLHTSPIRRELCKTIIILENLVVDIIQQRVNGIYALIDLIWM